MSASLDYSDSLAVANQALSCFKQRDFEGLKRLFNQANRDVLEAGRSRKFYRGFLRKFEMAAPMLDRVREVPEVRVMTRDDSWDFLAVAGKLRQEEHLVHVIVLTRENGGFRFDQLMSPHVLEYRAWEPFRAEQEIGALIRDAAVRNAFRPLRTLA